MRILPALAILACSLAFAAEKPEGPFAYDLYQRLGVNKTATDDDIKKAYRKLIRSYHPDFVGKGGEEAFKFITAAYDVLLNPTKRESYDRYGLNAPEFYNLRSSWETATGLTAPNAEKQVPPSAHNYRARQSSDERLEKSMRHMDELHDYFEKRHAGLNATTDAHAAELLLDLFSPLKFDLEAMTKHPRFQETIDLIFNDSVWKSSDPNLLLRVFIRNEWFRYTLEFEPEKLGAFLAKFDPSNPMVQELLYSTRVQELLYSTTHRFSPEVRLQREFLGDIGLVMASMLREDQYRGTLAGEKLLKQAYQVWTKLGYDKIGAADRDRMTPKLLSLLDFQEWRKNRTLARIAQTQPASYHHDLIDEYDKLREKYPEIFPAPTTEELRSKANRKIDVLDNIFKSRISGLFKKEDEETQRELIEIFKNTKAKDLESMATLSPYHFHDTLVLMLADPIWQKADPELLKSFVGGEWYRFLHSKRPKVLEPFLEKLKKDHPNIQELIAEAAKTSAAQAASNAPATSSTAVSPASEAPPQNPADCIQTEMFNFFDPFGFFKNR